MGACVDGGAFVVRSHDEYFSVVFVVAVAVVSSIKCRETQLATKLIGSIIISALTFAPWLWLSKSRDPSRDRFLLVESSDGEKEEEDDDEVVPSSSTTFVASLSPTSVKVDFDDKEVLTEDIRSLLLRH